MSKKYEGDIEYSKHRMLYHYCHNYSLIENYEEAKADNFKDWECHHRLETHNSDGKRRLVDLTISELKALNMYYNRPAEEFIFLTVNEHNMLHNPIGKKSDYRHSQTEKHIIREWQLRNHGRFYKCIETGEVKCEKDWLRAGYHHVRDVADGKRNHNKNYHFMETK